MIIGIVMTPSKKGDTTIITIEKVKKTQLDESKVAHVAGGQHSGLVVNKQQTCWFISYSMSVHLSFNVLMRN